MEREGKASFIEFFDKIELTKAHDGYFCRVSEVLTIVILGSLCGLKNMKQIHAWAKYERIEKFLKEHFGISKIPCYYWMLSLFKLIKPESLNDCFMKWTAPMYLGRSEEKTVSFDGKTIRSTNKMNSHDSPMHIVSAHIAQLGITIGQTAVEDKSNEIPAMRDLIQLLDLNGCIVVADALNCQKETVVAIVDAKADYILNVKGNQSNLETDIKEYFEDPSLRDKADTHTTSEKNRGRAEVRTAHVTNDVSWIGNDWKNLKSIGTITRSTTYRDVTTEETHFFISSKELTAAELLKHVRMEWSVETMHWLLDVHFAEDYCRVEDKNILKNLNMARKIALNSIKNYKIATNSKKAVSSLMFDCLMEESFILKILTNI